MPQRLRVFISSPGDVPEERLRADLILDKLSQDYSRFFSIEAYRWEHEAMLASKHFQDMIEPPSKFDIVVLILWSRLGTPLPERTTVRAYRGIDNRVPVTGTEWEFEDALKAARERGAPDLLAFRKISSAPIDPQDSEAQEKSFAQLTALNAFWRQHFVNRGAFLAAYDEFRTLDEFAHRLEQCLRKLIEGRIKTAAAPTRSAAEPIWLGNPFRGLQSYEFEHASIYFGRNSLVTKATEQLAGRAAGTGIAFLLVSGASGSGKSSLVKAGVVPRLCKPQRISATGFLRRVVFRPAMGGADVFLGLARSLTKVEPREAERQGVGLPELIGPGQDEAQLADCLRDGSVGYIFSNALGRVTEAARQTGQLLSYETAKLILLVDQLEELFTAPGIAVKERQLFVALLDALARSGVVWVIATLRADFWHRGLDIPLLVELCEGAGRLEVLAPSPAEIAEMIGKPAQAASLSFELHVETGLGLDSVLAEHAANASGVLPLLSFTLDELYNELKRHGGRVLTYASYEALGRLEGAIASRADTVWRDLPELARATLPRVLRALATVPDSADRPPVGQPAKLEGFAEGSPARLLLDAFVAARLLVATEEGSVPMVRVAHEALLTRWDRARSQLERDRQDLQMRARVERQFSDWSREKRAARRLLRDPDLANAVALGKRWDDELSPELRDYIRRSARSARLRQSLAASVAILVAISVTAWAIAAQHARDATREAEIAHWLANSKHHLNMGRIEPALEWAWYAFAAKPVAETRSAALAALMRISPYLVGRLAVADAFPQSLAWIDDQRLAYATSRGELDLLDISRGAALDTRWTARRIAAPASADPAQAVIGLRAVGSDRLLAVLRGGAVVEMDAADVGVHPIAAPQPAVLNALPHAVSVSADAGLIAAAPTEEPPRLYRCRVAGARGSPGCSQPQPLGSAVASAVEISPASDRVAVGMRAGRVEVFPVSGSAAPESLPAGFPVVSLAWNPGRDLLAAGGEDGTIAVFDIGTHTELFRFPASRSIVSTLRWSRSGRELAFACDGRIVCVARVPEPATAAPAQVWRLDGHANAVTQLAWSANGALLATADGHEIIIWSLQPDRQVAFDLVPAGDAQITEIASSPAGRRLAGARTDGAIGVWDTAPLVPDAGRMPVEETDTLRSEPREPLALAWRSDGALSAGYKDGSIVCWGPGLNRQPRVAQAGWEPFQLSFSDTEALAAVSADRRFYLMNPDCLDVGSAAPLYAAGAPLPARAVAAQPTGRRVPVSYNDPTTKGAKIAIWDVAARQIASWLPVEDPIAPLGLAVSPDGRLLAATGGNSFLKLYDLDNPSKPPLLLQLQAEETAGSVAFAPDGKLLAAIGADGGVYVWQVGAGAAELFLQVDAARSDAAISGRYASSLAWLGGAQLAVLLPNGTIRVVTLDPSFWRKRMDSLHFPPPASRSPGP